MTITLSVPLRWKSAQPDELAMLKDLQANILKGHGRSHTMNLFLKFNIQKPNEVKSWLATLKITDALKQLNDTEIFKATKKSGGLVTLCLLSANGYRAIGANGHAPANAAFAAGRQF